MTRPVPYRPKLGPPWSTCFLIVVTAIVFHVPLPMTCLVLVGYSVLESLDQWLTRKTRRRLIEDEMSGWEPDPEDPEYENKGDWTRRRLSDQDQVVVTRVAELLKRVS